MYRVIDKTGQVHGPVDVDVLRQWARENRLTGDMMLIDPITGETKRADVILEPFDVFPTSAPPPVMPQNHSFAQMFEPPFPVANLVDADLGTRFLAYLIDFAICIPVAVMAVIPIVGFIGAPLLAFYWLGRDSYAGPGQSFGKRAMKIKVVDPTGAPITFGRSCVRNLPFFGIFFGVVPIAGTILESMIVAPLGLLDVVLVLATKQRLGDKLGGTRVVRA